MRALLSAFVTLLFLAAPLQAADEASLIVGTWEFQVSSGEIEIRTFGPDKTYMQEVRKGDGTSESISGTYEAGDHNLVVTVESADPQTVEIGSTISIGIVSVDDKTLVLDGDGEELQGKRLSPAPSN